MAGQIIPINDIASAGVVKDMPAASLAQNIFTDCLNVRFRDGAVRKMEGEEAITTPFSDNIIYVAFWDNPNLGAGTGYYIVVINNGSTDSIVAIKNDGVQTINTLKSGIAQGGTWQHTLFNGGFTFIINNGVEKPLYVQDTPGNTNIASLSMFELPGWDSYYANEEISSTVWDSANQTLDFNLGKVVDFTKQHATITIINSATNTIRNFAKFTALGSNSTDSSGSNQITFTCSNDTDSNTTIITPSSAMVENGDTVTVKVSTTNIVNVRCGVLRAYKNLLVAGNLTEYDNTNTVIVRRLAGVVRTSDVAAPGSIPANWNPFAAGVNTADEFTLSSTGTVQDMAELQGRMYIYTNNSIHSLEQTGSSSVPFSVSTVTDSYGAQTLEAVQEYDGRHLVVGSNDIYVFGGHPGSIQSVADGRVRRYFIDNLNKAHEQKLFILKYQAKDELWICYPKGSNTEVNECLIWNYRLNNWTIRRMQSAITSGAIVPYLNNPNERVPLFSYSTEIMYGDKTYSLVNSSAYESFIERKKLGMSPEFDTETLSNIAMKIEGSNAVLTMNVKGSNYPGADVDPTTGVSNNFDVSSDYKIGIRETGRFLNYKLTETATNDWNLSGLQYEILKGGSR
jgi:hypothetical protein